MSHNVNTETVLAVLQREACHDFGQVQVVTAPAGSSTDDYAATYRADFTVPGLAYVDVERCSGNLLILRQAGDPDVLADRIQPRTLWAKEGYVPAGRPVAIWSKPITGYRNPDGSKTFRSSEAAEDATTFHAFKLEPTYPAARVRNGQGEDATQQAQPLTGDAAEMFDTITAWLQRQGWTVQLRNVDTAGGWTSHAEHLIRIDPRFTGWDRVRVIVHEATHALMHGDSTDYIIHRGDREAEADGVTYAVMTAYGQTDVAARSVRYVAGWAQGDTARITAAIERASAALDAIMDVLAGADEVTVRAPKTAKADNKATAAWLRSNNLPVRGAVWQAAKAGQRDVTVLAALAA